MNERLQETARMRRRSPGEGARAESSARKQAPAARKSLISSAAAWARPHRPQRAPSPPHSTRGARRARPRATEVSPAQRDEEQPMAPAPPGCCEGRAASHRVPPPLAPTGTPTALDVPVTITPVRIVMVPAGPWGHRGWPARGRWRRHRNRIPGARYLPRWRSSTSAAPLLFHLPLGFGEGEVSQMPTKSLGRGLGGGQ